MEKYNFLTKSILKLIIASRKGLFMNEVIIEEVELTKDIIKKLNTKFIAFDTETTGFSPYKDRIIELGAVEFIDGKNTKIFNSLVKTDVKNSYYAYQVNKISEEMLEDAPLEKDIYIELVNFLEEVLNGNIILVAHNAIFDMHFLKNTLERLGYSGYIRYLDTLKVSYRLPINSHCQSAIAKYLGIINEEEHRAYSDAITCGKILVKILERKI